MVPAALSGALAALAFPPFDQPWLVWVALVPFFLVLARCDSTRRAAALGAVAGFVFGLVVLAPLRSAHLWTGWAAIPLESLDAESARHSRFLVSLWIAAALWMAFFWAAFAGLCEHVTRGRRRLVLLAAPSLWVLVPEFLRVFSSGGFHWAMLGNAAAAAAPIRQLASIGGVWLISALVVGVNVVLATLIRAPRKRRSWITVLGTAAIMAAVVFWGHWRQRSLAALPTSLGVVALQPGDLDPSQDQMLTNGLDRRLLATIETTVQSLKGRFRLMVLPESVSFGTLTLDGSLVPERPRGLQAPVRAWEQVFERSLVDDRTVMVIGADTVEGARLHNSMLVFTSGGLAGCYHKRRLVPFAERGLPLWPGDARGELDYTRGKGPSVISSNGLDLGALICHEVLFPTLVRQTVRFGASVVVSGGNDGVFANPAVAEVNARAAQLRATESGRYLVRAMKTGVTAVIDPAGAEVARSPDADPTAILARIEPHEHLTAYVRFGDWVVMAAVVGALGAWWLVRRREADAVQQENRTNPS